MKAASPFSGPVFRQLQAAWARRLKKSGFVDVEGRHGFTDRHQEAYAVDMDPNVRQANAEYYALASAYQHTAVFAGALERKIWELHADGFAVREIARKLRTTKDVVQRRVEKHRARMLAENRMADFQTAELMPERAEIHDVA